MSQNIQLLSIYKCFAAKLNKKTHTKHIVFLSVLSNLPPVKSVDHFYLYIYATINL